MNEREDIIEKVQALLSKTPGRGATEAEAQAALAMAQKLLLKHNLTMTEVEAAQGNEQSAVGLAVTKTTTEWQLHLAAMLGQHMFVRIIHTWRSVEGEISPVLCFIGREQNVRVVQELYRWVEPQFVRIPREAALAEGRELKRSTKWIRSFRYGMLARVSRRLREQVAEAAAQDVKVTALTIRYADENKAFMKEHFPDTREVKKREVEDVAFAKGTWAGDDVSLMPESRQVKGE